MIRRLDARQRRDWLTLARTENVGPVAFDQLVDRFGSAAEALEAIPELALRGGRAAALRIPSAAEIDRELANGEAIVTEISEQGHVPELQFVNQAEMGVLLVDGEELIGAKQNRILNISILAPAQCALKIPVSCLLANLQKL